MPEVRPFFQKAMLLSEVGWNTPPFLTQGPEEPNDFLSPGSEMKWTPLHLGKQIYVYLSVCLSVCPSSYGTLPPSSPRVPKSQMTFYRRDKK